MFISPPKRNPIRSELAKEKTKKMTGENQNKIKTKQPQITINPDPSSSVRQSDLFSNTEGLHFSERDRRSLDSFFLSSSRRRRGSSDNSFPNTFLGTYADVTQRMDALSTNLSDITKKVSCMGSMEEKLKGIEASLRKLDYLSERMKSVDAFAFRVDKNLDSQYQFNKQLRADVG